MSLEYQRRLVDHLTPLAADLVVTDVRIGLSYTGVRLNSGATGLAWTPPGPDTGCCHDLLRQAPLAGRPAKKLLELLVDPANQLCRSIGLATANALLLGQPTANVTHGDFLGELRLTADDHVAMVGFFGPVIPKIKELGCRLTIIEKNSEHPEAVSPAVGRDALFRCSVALVTATSLINDSFDEICGHLGTPRAAVMLGPTTPLVASVFADTPLTQLSGVRVIDAPNALRTVSEGGGTRQLKSYLRFDNVHLPRP